MKNRNSRTWTLVAFLALGGVGAIAGTLGDLFHVLAGVLGYPAAVRSLPLGGQPLWVPPLFAGATWAIASGHVFILPMKRRSDLNWRLPVAGALGLLLLWASSGYVARLGSFVPDVMIGAAAAGAWWFLDRTLLGAGVAIFTGVAGMAVESWLSGTGAFFYFPEFRHVGGVPRWLFPLYAVASFSVGGVARHLKAWAGPRGSG